MNKKILLVVLVFLLALLALIIFSPKIEFREDVDYSKNNMVVNQTDKQYIEDIIHIGLNYLDIKEMIVVVKEIDRNVKIDDQYDAKASVVTNNYQFLVSLYDMKKNEAITTLAHELIHIHQYYTNDLYIDERDGEKVIVHNQVNFFPISTLNQVPYMERPWEVDAFDRQRDLAKLLEKELLK